MIMNKFPLIIFLTLTFCVCAVGVKAQTPIMSEKSANNWIAHFKSAEDIATYLDHWYIHTDVPSLVNTPMTRFDFIDMLDFHLYMLHGIAASQLKLKNAEEFYDYVKKNQGYALNFSYSASGIPAGSGSAVFKDVRTNDNVHFEHLDKLGFNICSADGNCYPEQELTEKEFYEWTGKLYGVKFDNVTVSNQPMDRRKMSAPLVKAIQTNFERVEKILNQSPNPAQKAEIIKSLPSKGRARIVKKLSFYLTDSPCVDLSGASDELKTAFKDGGIWGDYRVNIGDEGDIVFETNNTCEKGRFILLRVGTAIVSMMEKGIKRLK